MSSDDGDLIRRIREQEDARVQRDALAAQRSNTRREIIQTKWKSLWAAIKDDLKQLIAKYNAGIAPAAAVEFKELPDGFSMVRNAEPVLLLWGTCDDEHVRWEHVVNAAMDDERKAVVNYKIIVNGDNALMLLSDDGRKLTPAFVARDVFARFFGQR